jgi:hypothetical protein
MPVKESGCADSAMVLLLRRAQYSEFHPEDFHKAISQGKGLDGDRSFDGHGGSGNGRRGEISGGDRLTEVMPDPECSVRGVAGLWRRGASACQG